MTTFVDECLAGNINLDAIDDFIERWHNGEGGASLPAFLGFSDSDYDLWLEKPSALPSILAAHRSGVGTRHQPGVATT